MEEKKFDFKSLIGFVLISGVLMWMMYSNQPTPEELEAQEKAKQDSEVANARKSQVGSGDRSEKIRTYNYPQNRITDHRIGYTSMNLDRVMDGDMEDLIEALINEDQKKKLEGSI